MSKSSILDCPVFAATLSVNIHIHTGQEIRAGPREVFYHLNPSVHGSLDCAAEPSLVRLLPRVIMRPGK